MSFLARVSSLGALLAGCAAAQQQDPGAPYGNLALEGREADFSLGIRSMDDRGFGNLDDQFELGFDYLEPIGYRNMRLDGGLHFASDEGSNTRAGLHVHTHVETLETSLGVNVAELYGPLRPFAGVGGSFLFVGLRGHDDVNDTVFDDSDFALGGYAKLGLLFQITRTLQFGFELRHFEGTDVSLNGESLGTRSDELLFVFGTSFWQTMNGSDYMPR